METTGPFKTSKPSHDTLKSIINNRFELRTLQQETSSSKICKGYDLSTNKEVLIKIIKAGKVRSQFQNDYALLGQDVVPRIYFNDIVDHSQVLIYEMKGPDIQSLSNLFPSGFTPITVSMMFHLTILALEKLHSKEIIHTNLKPSKLLTGKNGEDEAIFLCGLEILEKVTKLKPAKSRSSTPSKKRPYENENVYSSLAIHAGDCAISYRDDLESLSYIVINLFTNGKFFKKFVTGTSMSKKGKEALIALKTNILSEILLSGVPLEIFDYIKYFSKLKNGEMPNYEYLKGLTLKLCQKYYVKKDVIKCLDWVSVPVENQNLYRSKMLSYFFCSSIPPLKKNKINRVDELGMPMKKKNPINPLQLEMKRTTSEHLRKNFQGLPIHETPNESAENSKIIFDDKFLILPNAEEYMNVPQTARLTLSDQVFISEAQNNVRFTTQFGAEDDDDFFFDDLEITSPRPPSSPNSSIGDPESPGREEKKEAKPIGINEQENKYLNIVGFDVRKTSKLSTKDTQMERQKSESGSSPKSKRSNPRLAPSFLKPEPMKYKMMPK